MEPRALATEHDPRASDHEAIGGMASQTAEQVHGALVVRVRVDAEPGTVVAPALIDAEALGPDGGALGFRRGDAEIDLTISRPQSRQHLHLEALAIART
jgi:hypothetical protein